MQARRLAEGFAQVSYFVHAALAVSGTVLEVGHSVVPGLVAASIAAAVGFSFEFVIGGELLV